MELACKDCHLLSTTMGVVYGRLNSTFGLSSKFQITIRNDLKHPLFDSNKNDAKDSGDSHCFDWL